MSVIADYARSLANATGKARPPRTNEPLWQRERNDRVLFNKAQQYVAAVERAERNLPRLDATGSNTDKLRYALDIMYRRIEDSTKSDASVGGSWRTMSLDEFKQMGRDKLAAAHMARLMKNRLVREALND